MANPLLSRQTITSNGANNMTGTAAVVSDVAVDTWQFNTISIEIEITGTPTGTLTLEGTNQVDPARATQPKPGATFVTLPASAMVPALPAVAGAAVSYLGGVSSGARFVRWRYVNSSGTGTLDAYVNATGA